MTTSPQVNGENAETVATYVDGGSTYEIDHLGIGRPDMQMGQYAVYLDGEQVAEFSAGVQLSLTSVQFTDAPADEQQLIAMAKEAVVEASGSDPR